jgi:hypothetical protein
MKIRLHVNKFEIKKGEKGYPWTIHTSKACIRAKKVFFDHKNMETEFNPNKRANPKVFLVTEGEIKHHGKGVFSIM